MRSTALRFIGAGLLATVVTACPTEPSPVDHQHLVSACKVEYQTIKTAYSASAIEPNLTVRDFLPRPLVYFELEVGPTTKPVQRTVSTLAAVDEVECFPVPVPLGSD